MKKLMTSTCSTDIKPPMTCSTISFVIADSGGPYNSGSSLLFRGHSYIITSKQILKKCLKKLASLLF